jgi:hypothetical protein
MRSLVMHVLNGCALRVFAPLVRLQKLHTDYTRWFVNASVSVCVRPRTLLDAQHEKQQRSMQHNACVLIVMCCHNVTSVMMCAFM